MNPDVAEYMIARYEAFHFKCPVCNTFKYAQFYKLYDEQGMVLDYLRNDQSGRTHSLKSFRILQACCGVPLQSRRVRGIYNPAVPCGRHCYNSKLPDCECACGGLLRGQAYSFN